MARWAGFGLVSFAFLVTMFGTTLSDAAVSALPGEVLVRRARGHGPLRGAVRLRGDARRRRLLALGIGAESLSALVASSTVVGLGQRLTVGAGLAAINERAPVERRGETASSFFVALYVGRALPVIGVGLAAEAAFALKTAGIAFSVAVAALVGAVLASLVRR